MNGREAAWMRMPEPSASGEKWREEMCTRCYIPPELTVTNDSNGCPILPVPIGLHDLNLSKTYANWIQGFTSIRELMQNWYDRTLEVLDGHPTALIDTGWVDGTHRLAFHELHRIEGKPRCASYVLEQRRPDGKVYVQLTNFATELPKDALIMGCSRKSTADAAGAYGEGMKVEINCLVARGVEVCIFTGSRRWNFVHNVEPGSSESKLFMQVTEVDQRCAHLSICLLADVSILNEVDRTCFLFLQLADVGKPMAPDKRGGDKVVEVLLHEDHHGKTFARGIFIKSEPTLVGIGLNFIAPLRLHKSFGFTRDRDDIDLELLIAWLPNVVSHLFRERKQDFGEALVWRLYDILDSAPQSDVAKHLALSFRLRVRREGESIDQAREHLADRLVGVFQARHHDKAQPYPIEAMSQRSSLQEERREAIFLQCTPVDVSEPLLKHLRLSKLCPTTERIWNQLQERVYELADWQPPSEQARDTAERFRSLALEWFGDALSSESLLFKEFPAGNPNVVAIGKKESRTILAVDVKLLDDSQATHEWIRKEQGQVCGDKQPDGTCGGACTLFRYSDALTQCLEKISPQLRGKLDKRQKMAMMRMQTRDLPNQPLPPPPKPPDTSGQRDDQDAVASTPTASSASGGQHKRKQCTPHSRDKLHAMSIQGLTQLAKEHGLPVERGTEKAELVDLLFASSESMQEPARAAGRAAAARANASGNQPLSPPPPPKPPATSGRRDDQDAVASTPTASSASGGQHKRKQCTPHSRDELHAMSIQHLTQLAKEHGLPVERGTEKAELADLLFAVIESTQEDASGSSGGQTLRGSTGASVSQASEGDGQSVPKQRRGAAYSLEQSAADLVRKCLNESIARGGTRPDAAIRSAGVAPRMTFTHAEQCTCDGQSALELFELTVTNGFRGIGSSRLPAYHEGTDVFDVQKHGCNAQRVQFVVEFASRIHRLALEVFGMLNPADCVRVFWEDAERIAFNRGGILFFNARYAEVLGHMGKDDFWTYWFVTFCHELAHNYSPGHDKSHEQAEETLIASHMRKLLKAGLMDHA